MRIEQGLHLVAHRMRTGTIAETMAIRVLAVAHRMRAFAIAETMAIRVFAVAHRMRAVSIAQAVDRMFTVLGHATTPLVAKGSDPRTNQVDRTRDRPRLDCEPSTPPSSSTCRNAGTAIGVRAVLHPADVGRARGRLGWSK